jgi:hypothetical protein
MTCHKYLVLTAVSLAAPGSTKASLAAQPDLEKLNLCYSSIAATSVTTWVPHEAGILKNKASM